MIQFGYGRTPDVVKNLIIINVMMYIFPYMTLGYNEGVNLLALHYPTSELFMPHQIVTHMFMHSPSDLFHLLFNMFALWMFGSEIERMWGAKRFLFYYLLTGLGAAGLHLASIYGEINFMTSAPMAKLVIANTPMLGASGAVFGILFAYAYQFPNRVLQLIFPPVRLKAWQLVTLIGVYELFMVMSRSATNVAHFAHLGGILFGYLIILFWKNQNSTNYRR